MFIDDGINATDGNVSETEEKKYVTTKTGRFHMVFDLMSFLENCTMVIVGAYFIAEVEEDFNPWLFSR